MPHLEINRMRSPVVQSLLVFALLPAALVVAAEPATWPQFRGRNSGGRALGTAPLPADIGPDRQVLWKVAAPPGHSSPIVWGDAIYLTAAAGEKLVTLALDRASGKLRWQVEAPHRGLERIHSIGSYAQPTPTTDGTRVVSLFGSSGLYCYDTAGKPLWNKPMGPFNNDFGAGSSPILVDDRVILCQDHDTDSFLMAIDKQSGRTLWRTDRSEFPRNYCTPVIWTVGGRKQIVVAATLRVVGYDFDSGQELWTVRGIARTVCMTPVVGDDGTLFVASWAGGGDPTDQIVVAPFEDAAREFDADRDGLLAESEVSTGPFKQRFSQVDRDKSGKITRAEYDFFRGLFQKSRNTVLAVKPGGRGDISATHVLWQSTKLVPFCASPLYVDGRLFTVKDGGIFSCLDAATGTVLKHKRLPATGEYYSSPVTGDGKIYFLNDEGKLTVTTTSPDGKILATADFGEPAYATPAIVDGRIYLRTAGHLYCFGPPGS
jgi:outer membrane protein assembly factor BamB